MNSLVLFSSVGYSTIYVNMANCLMFVDKKKYVCATGLSLFCPQMVIRWQNYDDIMMCYDEDLLMRDPDEFLRKRFASSSPFLQRTNTNIPSIVGDLDDGIYYTQVLDATSNLAIWWYPLNKWMNESSASAWMRADRTASYIRATETLVVRCLSSWTYSYCQPTCTIRTTTPLLLRLLRTL